MYDSIAKNGIFLWWIDRELSFFGESSNADSLLTKRPD